MIFNYNHFGIIYEVNDICIIPEIIKSVTFSDSIKDDKQNISELIKNLFPKVILNIIESYFDKGYEFKKEEKWINPESSDILFLKSISDTKILIMNSNNNIQIWDINKKILIKTIKLTIQDSQYSPRNILISKNGSCIISSHNDIRIFNLDTGILLNKLNTEQIAFINEIPQESNALTQIIFSVQSSIKLCKIYIWDLLQTEMILGPEMILETEGYDFTDIIINLTNGYFTIPYYDTLLFLNNMNWRTQIEERKTSKFEMPVKIIRYEEEKDLITCVIEIDKNRVIYSTEYGYIVTVDNFQVTDRIKISKTSIISMTILWNQNICLTISNRYYERYPETRDIAQGDFYMVIYNPNTKNFNRFTNYNINGIIDIIPKSNIILINISTYPKNFENKFAIINTETEKINFINFDTSTYNMYRNIIQILPNSYIIYISKIILTILIYQKVFLMI